jgi:4-amino-4-deoxy-L-arabinose transferase-like glycosyltransferase
VSSERQSIACWALLVTATLVQLPFLERGLAPLDEGSILAIADALRSGARLYVDRITPLAPLTYELLAWLFALFGTHLGVARLLQAGTFVACVLVAYAILRPLVGWRWAAAGAAALLPLKAFGFPLWTIVNYSQLAMLVCLMALALLLRFLAGGGRGWIAAAGIATGLAVATKQNLGLLLGAVLAATLLLQGGAPARRPRARAADIAILGSGAAAVLAVVLLAYAAAGSLGELLHRTLVNAASLTPHYAVALPDLRIWSLDAERFGPKAFAYFPSPLFAMALAGKLPLTLGVVAVELLVKVAYFLPPVLIAVGLLGLAAERWRGGGAYPWSGQALVIGFGAVAYASMLYRADWTHLMNVYPALLLALVVLMARARRARPLLGRAAALLLLTWIGAGAALGALILREYRWPVETARGRLLALESEAAAARARLAHLAAQAPGDRVLLLRAEPLYAFLADRPIPIPFDLVLPGILDGADDARVAIGLRDVDQVLYEPRGIPTVPAPITRYAPATSSVLATRFRPQAVLARGPIVLEPLAQDPFGSMATDLLEAFSNDLATGRTERDAPAVQRTSWLFYRVLEIEGEAEAGCLAAVYGAKAGERFVVIPMLPPEAWALPARAPEPATIRVEVRVASPRKDSSLGAARTLQRGDLPAPIDIPLDDFAGERVTIELCARTLPDGGRRLRLGWAEPRVVAGPSTPATPHRDPEDGGRRR